MSAFYYLNSLESECLTESNNHFHEKKAEWRAKNSRKEMKVNCEFWCCCLGFCDFQIFLTYNHVKQQQTILTFFTISVEKKINFIILLKRRKKIKNNFHTIFVHFFTFFCFPIEKFGNKKKNIQNLNRFSLPSLPLSLNCQFYF